MSKNGENMSWIFLLLLFHAGVSTIGTGGMSWILLSMLLHTGLFDNNTVVPSLKLRCIYGES